MKRGAKKKLVNLARSRVIERMHPLFLLFVIALLALLVGLSFTSLEFFTLVGGFIVLLYVIASGLWILFQYNEL